MWCYRCGVTGAACTKTSSSTQCVATLNYDYRKPLSKEFATFMSRPIEAVINLTNIRDNYALAKKLAPHSRVMAVVKANAYGHGATHVATALTEADAFGVACLAEALELREAGIVQPIVLLGGAFDVAELRDVVRYDLQLVIHSSQQLSDFLGSELSKQVNVWLKMDTGMHRLGFSARAFAEARRSLSDSGKVKELVLMSHFSCADQCDKKTTESQLALFNKEVAGLEELKSLANSAALISCPDTHCNWVRPGIMLYGADPLSKPVLPHGSLRPAMTLRSRLVAINEIAAGESVGYGQQWHAPQAARIGTVAIGYADGYPRHAVNGTPVLVAGHRASLVGRVSMDFITVDLTGLPEVATGDEVVLWGDGLPVEEVAAMADTISYQLLAGVQQRVNYRYLDK